MKDFWKNKNVLITGINGFVGGNIAKKLSELNANIFGLLRNNSKKSLLFFEKIDEKVTLIKGNILDKDLLTRIITEEKIDIIFHFAAQVEVGVSLINPYATYETNIKGTYSILEAVNTSKNKVKAIIFSSSDKSYGAYPKKLMPYKESYDLRPNYPYEVSKACADFIAQSYSKAPFNLPIVICRFSNIYGPGQLNFSALIPDLIKSYYGYSSFRPRSDGSQIRDYIFINDVVDLYLIIAQSLFRNKKKFSGEIFNCGNKKRISVKKIVQNIYIKDKKRFSKIVNLMKNKKTQGEIEFQFMDYKKVKSFFNWYPKFDLKTGLKMTTQWYKNFFELSKFY